ncbi:MAG: MBL fold metallo-hydrolase [Clostridia bacterium]|nr:MBL fold metallo-hydrolase [Clostridia bacterium]
MARRKSKKSKTSLVAVLIVVIILIVGSKVIPQETWDSAFDKSGVTDSLSSTAGMAVHFVDVGQGDCTVVESNGHFMLIDSGEADKSQTVINYLNNLGVEKLDYCIATHPHSDHMGSMAKVLSQFNAENLIMPELSEINIPTTATYEDFLLSAEENCDEIIAAEAGYTYSMGEVEIQILGPCDQDEDLNNMSVVAKVIYGESSFLITGDCSFDEEDDIMDNYYNQLDSDVLKVGHHGSAGSTSVDWLEAIEPDVAVISVGVDNSYGHPTKKVLNNLADFDCEIYRTDEAGSIVFETDGKSIALKS